MLLLGVPHLHIGHTWLLSWHQVASGAQFGTETDVANRGGSYLIGWLMILRDGNSSWGILRLSANDLWPLNLAID